MSLKSVLRASPATLFNLFGLLLLSVALLGSLKVGSVEAGFRSVAERAVVGIVAVMLIAVGFVLSSRRSPASQTIEHDPAFWRAMLGVMPPIFVKEYTTQLPDVHTHFLENAALLALQGPAGSSMLPPDLKELIAEDHARGDRRCRERGISWQLELCDPGGVAPPMTIMTVKHRFDHAKRRFVVGMSIPVQVSLPPGTSAANVRLWNNQPLFAPILGGAEPSMTVPVGRAWHRPDGRER
jgi:hypothetical protein